MEENNELEGLEFEPVTTTPEANGGAQPDPSGFTVYPSGLSKGNTKATQLWIELCSDLGLDPKTAVADMGAIKARKLVQVKAMDQLKAKSPVATRWYGVRKDLLALHLGGVYQEHPELRPAGRRTATVTRTKDKKGVPCLVISLATALPKRVLARAKAAGEETLPEQDL